ncbi:polysaccharide lyase 6 family protein [Roseimicrobium gellanilyticum]|uniref:polysaccharide lyase 6 family protein n=1 Tax=Roseimicrobium gellanilyticum TaxID=748857 RepID=UPI001475694D|nr:polysaccharide lyase 6 family protein [Roseimicrobium gellanilyticum]
MSTLLRDLKQGTTVEVPDGTYTTKGCRTLQGLRGTKEKPIVIRAKNRGKVVIVGESGFILRDCEYAVIEGFVFENDADQQCVMLDNCKYTRVTRNVFRPKERARPRHWEHWVTVDGARSGYNRIDRNRFERKVNRGSPLFVRGDDAALVCSQRDRIDHNHFRDVIYADRENGHETIRTGGNDLGASGRSSFTTIEHNLLERCSGEDEIISIKSSDNIIRDNTLINCRGAICMRLGNRSVVSGNVIVATEDAPGVGGIKLFGFEHQVTGNYFSGLTGTKHEAPFSLIPGMHDTPTTENIGKKYDDMTATAPTRCTISGNTWVDCAPLQFGYEKEDKKWPLTPNACVFTGNHVIRTRANPKPMVNLGAVRDLQAKDNTAYSVQASPQDAAWTSWFVWEREKPIFKMPVQLTEADVGPDAAGDD